jgi:hypothetical protein
MGPDTVHAVAELEGEGLDDEELDDEELDAELDVAKIGAVHAHFGEVQDKVFGQAVISEAATGGKARDHHRLQLDLDVFDGVPACFAHGEQRVGEMRAVTTAEHQLGRTAVHEFIRLRSCTLTFPLPAPPPTWAVPLFNIPHDQERMSISLLCTLSFDSPVTPLSFRNMSTAISYQIYMFVRLVSGFPRVHPGSPNEQVELTSVEARAPWPADQLCRMARTFHS